MFLLSRPELIQLVRNGQPEATGQDHFPPAKLFLPKTGKIWLLSESDPNDPGRVLALYDTGEGDIRFDWVEIAKIAELQNKEGERVRRDPYFVARQPMTVYHRLALHLGYISDLDSELKKALWRKRPGPSPE